MGQAGVRTQGRHHTRRVALAVVCARTADKAVWASDIGIRADGAHKALPGREHAAEHVRVLVGVDGLTQPVVGVYAAPTVT